MTETTSDRPKPDSREPALDRMVDELRKEAAELKDCVTRYSFQALNIGSVAVGVILHFEYDSPMIGLGGLVVMLVALATCRVGTYKYANSNRHYGYELHLSRTKDVPEEYRGRWKDEYRYIDWEEAMRAWRVVHPTLLNAIQRRGTWLQPDRYKKNFLPTGKSPKWYSQQSLLGPRGTAKYYPGAYIATMLWFLEVLALFGVLLMAFMCALLFRQEVAQALGDDIQRYAEFSAIVLTALSAAFLGLRWRGDQRRREILEDGILSIHSCALVWQATVIAHYTARDLSRIYKLSSIELARHAQKITESGTAAMVSYLEQQGLAKREAKDGVGLLGYTFWLGRIAGDIAAMAGDLQGWVGGVEAPSRSYRAKPG